MYNVVLGNRGEYPSSRTWKHEVQMYCETEIEYQTGGYHRVHFYNGHFLAYITYFSSTPISTLWMSWETGRIQAVL
jgi:hypothetical protein